MVLGIGGVRVHKIVSKMARIELRMELKWLNID